MLDSALLIRALLHRVVSFLLDWIDPQPGRVRFLLKQKRKARTALEESVLIDVSNYVAGRGLLRPDDCSLAELSQAIYESALDNFMALYGDVSVIILSEADQLMIDYQEKHQRIILQPADPLAVITLIG